jgi:ABC-type phosphate/phosphonate transport system permease subunit
MRTLITWEDMIQNVYLVSLCPFLFTFLTLTFPFHILFLARANSFAEEPNPKLDEIIKSLEDEGRTFLLIIIFHITIIKCLLLNFLILKQ